MKHGLIFLLAFLVTAALAQGPYQRIIIPPGDPQLAPFRLSAISTTGKIAQVNGAQPNGFLVAAFTSELEPIWATKVRPVNPANTFNPTQALWTSDERIALVGPVGQNLGVMFLDPSNGSIINRMYHTGGWWGNYYYSYGATAVATDDGGLVITVAKIITVEKAIWRIDGQGDVVWAVAHPTAAISSPEVAVTGPNDDLFLITGTSEWQVRHMNMDGTLLWTSKYLIYENWNTLAAVATEDGGLVLATSTGTDVIAVRFDAVGVVQWTKRYPLGVNFYGGVTGVQEADNGELIFFPGPATLNGAIALRTDAQGNALNLHTFPPEYFTTSFRYLGQVAEDHYFHGSVYVPIDGGYLGEQRILMRTDETFVPLCGGAQTVITAEDGPVFSPVAELLALQPEPVLDWTFAFQTSPAEFTAFDLCAAILGEQELGQMPRPRVHPTLLNAGDDIQVEFDRAIGEGRVLLIGADGRLLREWPLLGARSIRLSTAGLPAGLHLLRFLNGADQAAPSTRLMIVQ